LRGPARTSMRTGVPPGWSESPAGGWLCENQTLAAHPGPFPHTRIPGRAGSGRPYAHVWPTSHPRAAQRPVVPVRRPGATGAPDLGRRLRSTETRKETGTVSCLSISNNAVRPLVKLVEQYKTEKREFRKRAEQCDSSASTRHRSEARRLRPRRPAGGWAMRAATRRCSKPWRSSAASAHAARSEWRWRRASAVPSFPGPFSRSYLHRGFLPVHLTNRN